MRLRVFLFAFATAALLLPQIAHACPVCFGDIGGPAARGLNNGILVMLGVVFAVQFGFVAMFIGIMRRGKHLPGPDTLAHEESPDVPEKGRR